MALDILGKNNLKKRGDHGYVISVKKYNLKLSVAFLFSCLVIYTLGAIINNALTPFFTITSVLMVLPTSQFLAKYFSYSKYKILVKDNFERLESISEDFLVLGELPIIRGKKVYETKAMVVTNAGVYTYIDPHKDINQSRKETLDTKAALESIIKPKNIQLSVTVYDDLDKMYDYLDKKVKSIATSPDEKLLGTVAKCFIEKTH